VSADITVNGGPYTNAVFNLNPFSIGGIDVPEPTTMALIGVGLAGLSMTRRRRAAQQRLRNDAGGRRHSARLSVTYRTSWRSAWADRVRLLLDALDGLVA